MHPRAPQQRGGGVVLFASVPAVRILVTGAAGQIGYVLAAQIARGDMFGDAPVILHLLDVPAMVNALNGVRMELEDGAYPLLRGIVTTSDLREAFTAIDYAILVGSMPRKVGMERSDLLKTNCAIFKTQGKALDEYANKNVKVLVVGNPANTNCAVAAHFAPSIPRANFSALTRLDHNRAVSLTARRLGVALADVQDVCIWGNHSTTQYPDVSHAHVGGRAVLTPESAAFFRGDAFVATVQKRGAAIIEARKMGSAMSASQAIVDHVRDWHRGTGGRVVSMAVASGAYGVPKGVFFSYPCRVSADGVVSIVEGWSIDAFSQAMLDKTYRELDEEWRIALTFVGQ